jgi:DNA repair exonuclease SbcCD ATPase subunit
METKEINIPAGAKIRVYWSDKPENYSKDNRSKIRKYFAKKYGVPSSNINVVYKPVKLNKNGELIEIDGATIDNIMNIPYQRELFKEWLDREGKDVNFKHIIALDNKINAELDLSDNVNDNTKYKLKSIELNNFLSFGAKNTLNIEEFEGLTVVNSMPQNQGGKSTLTIDAIKFLFFGKTTKTDKNEEVFNQFTNDEHMSVSGVLSIEDEGDLIIERNLTRKPKRKGGWNISNKLNYYRLLPNGDKESLNDEDAKKTTEKLKEVIGTESDFDLMVLATSRNLDDLVDSTGGEKKMKSNIYDSETLKSENKDLEAEIETLKSEVETLKQDLKEETENNKKLNDRKYNLIASKEKIDVEIDTLNPKKLKETISTLTESGKKLKKEITELNEQVSEIGEVNFDEDKDFAVVQNNLENTEEHKSELISSGICKSCNRPLDDVDNTNHIKECDSKIEKLKKEESLINKKLDKINEELEKLSNDKKASDAKNKLELNIDRLEVELEALRNKFKSKSNDLKKYNQNLESINKNREIDIEISDVDTKITVSDNLKMKHNTSIVTKEALIGTKIEKIESNTTLIDTIEVESKTEKIYKIYIEMIGKKGISKLLLRSVLPIINGELQRLLEDTTDFEVEVYINDKNEVKYLLVKDGVEKPLKSASGFELTAASIALRCVLGKLSSLPKPNFVTFDEVLGRVAPDNIHKMKPLFDKISDMFDIVFFITQIPEVKDWSNKIINITKENNISRIDKLNIK